MDPSSESLPPARATGTFRPPKREKPEPARENIPNLQLLNNCSVHPASGIPSRQKRIDIAHSTRGYYYGPMPVQDFFEDFMPYKNPNRIRKKPKKVHLMMLTSVASQSSESEMYTPFIQALKFWPPHDEDREIKLEYYDNHLYGDPNCSGLAVDVAVGESSTKLLWHSGNHICFAEHETHTVFKSHVSSDPFVYDKSQDVEPQKQQTEVEEEEADGEENYAGAADNEMDVPQPLPSINPEDIDESNATPGPRDWGDYAFENSSEAGISCRGQLAFYAAAAMTVQHRYHFFQLVIFGTYARFLRWDRSSAIVSQRFNYASEPELIFNFYRRLAQLTAAQRGHDSQIIRSSREEAESARGAFKTFFPDGWHGRFELPKKLRNRPIESQPFRTLTAADGVKYIICAPVFYPECYTAFGRSTRRSLAYRIDAKQLYFLKDCYSENYPTTLKESDVYERIKAKKVKKKAGQSIPRGFCDMIFGGDVPGTETNGHLYWKEPWVFGKVDKPPKLVGHRIMLKQVGTSVRTFPNCKTLLTCAADAMEAHSWLLHELRILHRDISPGNILMERDPEHPDGLVRRGFLIDFDHALDLDRNRNLLSPGHCGTLQFMSAALLMDENLVQSGVDDRESCFHSIVYLGMLHLQHSQSKDLMKLHGALKYCFESFLGQNKAGAFAQQYYSGIGWENRVLQKVVQELEEAFSWRYRRLDIIRNEEYIAMMRANQKAALELLENRDWMHEVLWKHVNTMPEPTGEQEFVDNVYHSFTPIPPRKSVSQSQNTLNRLGLDGHLPGNVDDSEERASKRRRT